jgi:RimJ/RimL family protein N-acetyltransferase
MPICGRSPAGRENRVRDRVRTVKHGCMGWSVTGAVDEFLAEAGPFLRAEPARNTVVLSVTENLRVRAPAGRPLDANAPGPLFGWWQTGSGGTGVSAAFMHTPGFPVFLTSMSCHVASELAGVLAEAARLAPGVNAEAPAAEAFADSWRRRTGLAATVRLRTRLYRLGVLRWPDPGPRGAPRAADERDRDLLAGWFDAFAIEAEGSTPQDHTAVVDERLSYGGITVWEADGAPVSFAGFTRAVANMVRIGPVYTPPALRGRGYAGGVTAAVSQAALAAGATEVVLYTDLANPTSNALYERLGYRPIEDRVVLSFT